MDDMKRKVFRIEANFAACEGTYWVGYCAVSGFVAVYLSHRGLSNAEIGLTTSLGSMFAIFLQLLISNILDRHPEQPIKLMIAGIAAVSMITAGVVGFLPVPILMMIVAYAVTYALGLCNNGYLNAQLVQYNNVGIPARYGWPRGVGSLCYAVAAYIYGILVERYSPDLLIPLYIGGTALTVIAVLLMPVPRTARAEKTGKAEHVTSYREMLIGNPTLIVLLICTLMNGIGNMAGYTFILRVVEKVGGGTAQYGISEFIRAGAEFPALFASGWLLKRFKAKGMLAVSFLFYGLRLVLLAFADTMWVIYAASAMNMLCVGLSLFSSVLFVNSIVRDVEKVRGQSLCALCGSVGSIVGSAYAGVMIDHVGLQVMFLTSSAFCIAAFAGMFLFCKPEKHPVRG